MAQDITELLVRYRSETTELNKAKSQVDQLASQIGKTDVNYKKLDKEQKKTYDSIVKNNQKASDGLGKMNGMIKGAVMGYASFTFMKQATKLFADFDDQLKRTQALTGATAVETMELEKQSKLLGKTTAFSASQVAQAQGNMAQSGLKVNEILAATPGVLSLASAAQIDMASATDLTTSALNIFGLEARKATSVADILATAQSKSAGNAQWFGMAIQNAGANAKSLGYDLEHTTAILATLAPAFKEGGSAGTSLNAILRDLTKGMDKQGNIMINNKKVMVAQNGSMLSMDKIIANVTKSTKGMTDVQKRQALATVLGDESMRGFNVLLGQGAEKITEYDKIMDNSTGTAKTMADTMESGLGGSLRNLQSGVEAATISLVEALLPGIRVVVETATGLASIVGKVADLYRDYPGIMWSMTAALGAYVAIQKATVLWNTLINASNPFGWIKIAITAAVAALAYFENKFGTVSKMMDKVAGWFGLEPKEKTATSEVNLKEIPKHAKGTNNAPGGISLVGEEGPELVNLNKGSQVIPAGKTREMLGGRNVQIEGDRIEINITSKYANVDEVVEEVKEYLDRRDRRKNAQIMSMLGN